MKNVFETVIGWYKNYTNLTKKQRKLRAIRSAVELIKDQLGSDVDNVMIRWIEEKGEAEATIWLSDNSKTANLLYEIWRFLYPNYEIISTSVEITTYDLSQEIKPTDKEEAELVFQTCILSKKVEYMEYANYILLDKDVIDNIPIYIYIRIRDKEETDDC